MRALDTNVLIRFVVNDDKQQGKKVLEILKDAEKKSISYYVRILVVLEMVWVLKAVYKQDQAHIIRAIEHLNSMPVLIIEKSEAVYKALNDAKTSSLDLADLLIGHCSKLDGCESVLTFDKKAAMHHSFNII